jgi:hypothetical protein
MDATERYRCRVISLALASRNQPIVSHASAAAMWGIPIVGSPRFLHVLSSVSTGTRVDGGIRRHGNASMTVGIEEHDDVMLTSFTRTVVEFAHMVSFTHAVVALDWALIPSTPQKPKPVATREEMHGMISALGIVRGRRDLLRALDFANPLSGSPGESISRANFARAGLPIPELQVAFYDDRGLIGFVDFWWAAANLIGEFDGVGKYLQEEFTKGESSGDIVVAEKRREDRLRASAARPEVARWGWTEANSVDTLRDQLVAAGLRVAPGASAAAFDSVHRRNRIRPEV